jgi:hypothetical protein
MGQLLIDPLQTVRKRDLDNAPADCRDTPLPKESVNLIYEDATAIGRGWFNSGEYEPLLTASSISVGEMG